MKTKAVFRLFSWVVLVCMVFSSIGPGPRTVSAQSEQPPATPSGGLMVSGQVLDASGHPLFGVSVADRQGHSTVTGQDGRYELSGLEAGRVVVTPVKNGSFFIPYYQVVNLVGINVSEVNFHVGQPPQRGSAAQQPGERIVHLQKDAGINPQPAPTPGGGLQALGEISAQAAMTDGQPGLSYSYLKTMGQTRQPYAIDTEHLNAPSGMAFDTSGNLLVVEPRGKRLLGFDETGAITLAVSFRQH
jgi:hypothetical protein